MKFLADENVDARLIQWLKKLGYDVMTATKGVRNSSLFQLAKKFRRILITNDTDFLNTLLYSPRKHPGIIVLRLLKPTIDNQKKAFINFLPKFRKELKKRIIELFEEGFRIIN